MTAKAFTNKEENERDEAAELEAGFVVVLPPVVFPPWLLKADSSTTWLIDQYIE